MTEVPDEFLALLAHELRTPVAAVIGYHDLMSEGILGTIDPRLADSIGRMRTAANQLLALVSSLSEAGITDMSNLHVDLDDEDPCEIVEAVLASLAAEATGRSTTLNVDHTPKSRSFRTDRDRVERCLTLAMHAAIKNTAGGELHVHTDADDVAFLCIVRGANLESVRDRFSDGTLSVTTAAAMRLAMAAQAVRPLDGTMTLDDAGLTIRVPVSSSAD